MKGEDAVYLILILTYLMSISCLLHPKSQVDDIFETTVDDIFETTVSIHSHDILQFFEREHSVAFYISLLAEFVFLMTSLSAFSGSLLLAFLKVITLSQRSIYYDIRIL